MKASLLFICGLSLCSVSFTGQSEGEKASSLEKFPTILIVRNLPDKANVIFSRYDWVKSGASGEWVGFLQVKCWDSKSSNSKLSRRMSIGEYLK